MHSRTLEPVGLYGGKERGKDFREREDDKADVEGARKCFLTFFELRFLGARVRGRNFGGIHV